MKLRSSRFLLAGFPAFSLALTLAAAAGDFPSTEEYLRNWPRFRGPTGSGVSTAGHPPQTCDPATGANIAWSTEVPAPGFNSPVIWESKVFLSGGDENRREVLCFAADSGQLLWRTSVPNADGAEEKAEAPDQCGMAAPTAATDGRRVYAFFANGDLAALTMDGAVVWTKHFTELKNPYGLATSLLTWQDRLVVQLDQGDSDDKLSKLIAFDGPTGNIVWETARPVGASWATPIAIEAAGHPQLITLAVPWVIGYSAQDGSELWRADCLDGEVTPSPVFAGNLLYVVSPSNKLQAIRPDGHGDVTKTHLPWLAEDGIPDVTSPVCDGELVFLADSSGTLTCYDALTGKKQWTHDLAEECRASPSIADRHLYLLTKKGILLVLDAGRTYHEIARSALGEEVFASPAFLQDRIFIRGVKHLFCVSPTSAKP